MTKEFSNFAARLRLAVPCQEDFNALALELFALQFKHNASYGKFCEARGVSPENISRWNEIPAIPTSAFKELELSCLPPDERTHVFHSSGTTEQKPSRHFHNAESLAVYEASLWPWFAENILSDSRLAILTPPPSLTPNSSLVHMAETVRRKCGADESVFLGKISSDGSWTLDFENALNSLKQIEASGESALIFGTAFSFVHLLDFLAERNLRIKLPSGSRVMETGGYKGRSRSLPKAELHSLITDFLSVSRADIICEYGMSELSSQAYDNSQRVLHFPPWVRVQIIAPETGVEVSDGETGLIRIFDLANVFSVMAVQAEDLGVRRGDGFELIGRAEMAEQRGCSLMTA